MMSSIMNELLNACKPRGSHKKIIFYRYRYRTVNKGFKSKETKLYVGCSVIEGRSVTYRITS